MKPLGSNAQFKAPLNSQNKTRKCSELCCAVPDTNDTGMIQSL